jgi:hypothetical protein
MTDLSPTLGANLYEADKAIVASILRDSARIDRNQPCVAKRVRGCGLAILAADTGALAHRIAQICDQIAQSSPGHSCDTAGDAYHQKHELLLPESVAGEVITNLRAAGCTVISDADKPKEPFDVYRFRLTLPSNADKAALVLRLSATSNFLFNTGRRLYLEAEQLLDPKMLARVEAIRRPID